MRRTEAKVALTWAVFVGLFLAWQSAYAEPPPCQKVYTITGWETHVPCRGRLLPDADAAAWYRCVEVDLPAARGDLMKLRNDCEADARKHNKDVAGHEVALAKCEASARRAAGITRPWHQHPWVLLTAGFVAGTVTAYAVTRVVDSD
jgi:hypothetical protein